METNGYHCHVSLSNDLLSTSILNGEARLKVGGRYYVRRSNDVWHPATVIDIRPCKFEQDTRFEYKVHYQGYDGSCDEWITTERFYFDSDLKNLVEHDIKIPTNRKRARETDDEIAQESTKEVILKYIQFGDCLISTLYPSKFPGHLNSCYTLYICQFCLKYMEKEKTLRYHQTQCIKREPPGTKIYDKDSVAVYEVDGKVDKLYCQLLCLLSKLFLDLKTLYYDTEGFFFYVLTKTTKQGSNLIGYFSKEKESSERNNLACILILPPHQGQGFGKFLISFSYELSKLDNFIGSPEKPLSIMGRKSYMSYWICMILKFMKKKLDKTGFETVLDIREISQNTCIAETDILEALMENGFLNYRSGATAYVTPELLQRIENSTLKELRIKVDLCHLRYVPLKERMEFNVKV